MDWSASLHSECVELVSFRRVIDDGGASAKIEGYRVLERGDIGLLVRESGKKSHFTQTEGAEELFEFRAGL
jgi:hypothetical protein